MYWNSSVVNNKIEVHAPQDIVQYVEFFILFAAKGSLAFSLLTIESESFFR
jgi:hypothetical protein